jgi:hypothetical protein
MSSELEKRMALDSVAGRKIEAALAKLGVPTERRVQTRRYGHLIFALDLTGSREAGLREARLATAGMFDAVKAIGAIAVKLIYYRGWRECRAGDWHSDPAILTRNMQGLSCHCGYTQIRRVLRFALKEWERLDGMVFIGDHCEEDEEDLTKLAATLGDRSIPLFIFHECADDDGSSLAAKPIFERMANVSGGFYCEFKPNSADVLRELLSTVGAFSVASRDGVKRIGPAVTPEAQKLQARLLLPAPPKGSPKPRRG